MAHDGEVDRDELLQELLNLATEKVPSDLGQSVGILSRTQFDLQAHIDCAQDDLRRLATYFQEKRHLLDCAIKDLARIRTELALISAASKEIRKEILTVSDTAQIAVLIDPLLKVLSIE